MIVKRCQTNKLRKIKTRTKMVNEQKKNYNNNKKTGNNKSLNQMAKRLKTQICRKTLRKQTSKA